MRKNGTPSRTVKTRAKHSAAIGLLPLCLSGLALAAPSGTHAETPAAGSTRSFNIAPQPLYSALSALAEQSGVQFVYNSALVKGVGSPGVSGRYSLEGALKRLLAGSGIGYRVNGSNTVTLEKSAKIEPQSAATMQPVTVIGKTNLDPDDPYNLSYTRTNTSLATKTDTPIMETPASIQVVNKAVLHDQQSYRLQDAIKNVSGVQSYHSYGGDHEQFVMRGFLQSTVNYRNGIRIPFTKFDLANVERVEVIKGASAMMYGFGDPGGLISTVTKQPSSTPYYSVEQRFGSYDFYRTEASATGPVSKEHGLNYRLDMSYLDTGSFRQNMGNDRIFFAPTLSWEATPDTKFTLSYEYFDENNAYDYGIPAVGNQLARIPISKTFVGRSDLRNSTTNNLVDFRIDHRVNDQVKLNAGVVSSQYEKYWQGFYTGRVNETPGNSFGNAARSYWFSPENAESLTAWVNGTFDFETYGVRHKLLLGGEYYNSQLKYDGASGTVDTINIFNPNIAAVSDAQLSQIRSAPYNFSVNTENTSKAIYFQDQMTFWDKLHVMGGFRYDWVDRTQDLSWWAPAGKDARNDDVVSPRVGIVYQPVEWLSLFGSFTESFGPANDYDNGGAKLYDLFDATQFEGGVKTQFFDGKLNASVAYFDLERTQFFQDPNSNLINMQVPVKGSSKGVELDVQGQLYEGLSVIGTYAYTDAKITDDVTAPANIGNRLPFAPSHQGSAWLKYDFDDELLKGFSVGAGVYVSGRRYGDAANSYFDRSYARLDLMAAYKRKLGDVNLTTQVNVNNVNDAEYYILRSRRTNLPAEPLTVMGSIKLEY